MLSYLYYERSISLVPDTDFDQLCKEMLEHWEDMEHPHKHLITKEDLEAGTGYALKYPLMVQSAAIALVEKMNGRTD